jgi:hypothetical protein
MEAATTIEQLMALVSVGTSSERVLLGIDGFDGTGKTTLAFTLAEKLGGIRVGLDSYVEKDREADRYVGLLRLQDLARDLSGLLQCFRYVVVDGVCLSEAFAAIGVQPDLVIYVKKISPQGLWHDGFHLEDYSAGARAGGWLANSVYSYHQQYQPHVRASVCYSWAGA